MRKVIIVGLFVASCSGTFAWADDMSVIETTASCATFSGRFPGPYRGPPSGLAPEGLGATDGLDGIGQVIVA